MYYEEVFHLGGVFGVGSTLYGQPQGILGTCFGYLGLLTIINRKYAKMCPTIKVYLQRQLGKRETSMQPRSFPEPRPRPW